MANQNALWFFTDYWGYQNADFVDDFQGLLETLTKYPDATPFQLKIWSDNRVDGMEVTYQTPSSAEPIELRRLGSEVNNNPGQIPLDPKNPIKSIQFWGANKPGTDSPRLGMIGFKLAQDSDPYYFGNSATFPLGTLYIPAGYIVGGLWGYSGAEVNGFGAILFPTAPIAIPST